MSLSFDRESIKYNFYSNFPPRCSLSLFNKIKQNLNPFLPFNSTHLLCRSKPESKIARDQYQSFSSCIFSRNATRARVFLWRLNDLRRSLFFLSGALFAQKKRTFFLHKNERGERDKNRAAHRGKRDAPFLLLLLLARVVPICDVVVALFLLLFFFFVFSRERSNRSSSGRGVFQEEQHEEIFIILLNNEFVKQQQQQRGWDSIRDGDDDDDVFERR